MQSADVRQASPREPVFRSFTDLVKARHGSGSAELNPFRADTEYTEPSPRKEFSAAEAFFDPFDSSGDEDSVDHIDEAHSRELEDGQGAESHHKDNMESRANLTLRVEGEVENSTTAELKKSPESCRSTQASSHHQENQHHVNWHPSRHVSKKRMQHYIQVKRISKGECAFNFESAYQINMLVQVDVESGATKWMIPVDRTGASMRALDCVLKLADPKDHNIIVNVRELALNGGVFAYYIPGLTKVFDRARSSNTVYEVL